MFDGIPRRVATWHVMRRLAATERTRGTRVTGRFQESGAWGPFSSSLFTVSLFFKKVKRAGLVVKFVHVTYFTETRAQLLRERGTKQHV